MFKIKDIPFFKVFLLENESIILKDLANLIACQSFASKSSFNYPLGKEVAKGFAYLAKMAKRDQLKFKNFANYACEISLGKGKKTLALLHHLDVMPIQDYDAWKTDPFILTIKKRKLFGRGVNDNKGPLIYSYYLLKYLSLNSTFLTWLNKKNFKLKIIVGGAEETSWAGINYYKKYNSEPDYAFSPDGNYPLVYLEKAILQLEFTYHFITKNNYFLTSPKQNDYLCFDLKLQDGNKLLNWKNPIVKSRNPHRLSENIIFNNLLTYLSSKGPEEEFVKIVKLIYHLFIFKNDCSNFDLTHQDNFGPNSVSLTTINSNEKVLTFNLDFRFSHLEKKLNLLKKLKTFPFTIKEIAFSPAHYVDPQSFLVQSLHQSYQKMTHSQKSASFFSGKSYARAFKNSVAFGPTFVGEITNCHQANECQDLESLIFSTQIIFLAVNTILKKG